MKFSSDRERNIFSVVMIIICLLLAYFDMETVTSVKVDRFSKVVTKNLEV